MQAAVSLRRDEVLELSKRVDAAIGLSMMGITSVPASYPLNLGMCGMHGKYPSIKAQSECDLLLAVGQPLLGDVGFEPCALLLETLEREIGQFGRQNLRLFGVGRIQRQFDVIHNIM